MSTVEIIASSALRFFIISAAMLKSLQRFRIPNKHFRVVSSTAARYNVQYTYIYIYIYICKKAQPANVLKENETKIH